MTFLYCKILSVDIGSEVDAAAKGLRRSEKVRESWCDYESDWVIENNAVRSPESEAVIARIKLCHSCGKSS